MKINTVIHNPYSLPLWCWVWHDMSDPAGCASYLMRLSLFGIGGGLNLSNRSRCTKDPNQKFIKKKYQRGFKSQGTKAKISGAVNPRESMLQRYQKRPLLNTGSGGCTHCLRHSFMGPNSIGISWNVTETSEPKNQKLEKYHFGDLRGNLQTCN